MKNYLREISASYAQSCRRLQIGPINSSRTWVEKNSANLMMLLGVGLVLTALPELAMAQGEIDPDPINRVIQILLNDLIQGSFGALIMVVAGLVAIVSSAMGGYRAAMSALVVAVGAFILRSFVSAFWPEVDLGN